MILTYNGFGNSPANPRWGDHYACPGTIRKISADGLILYVTWDNGKKNTYRNAHLSLYEEDTHLLESNPNTAFVIHKIKSKYGSKK